MRNIVAAAILASLIVSPSFLRAEIVAASDTHFVLRHEAVSALETAQLWERLIRPEKWWHPDHTYSGDSANLKLDATAGGLWREDWEGGSVSHGRVLYVKQGAQLRMEAPFGPLQGLGAYTIWTITISPVEGGSKVMFDEMSTAPPGTDMAKLAEAVDFVKEEAIQRLASD